MKRGDRVQLNDDRVWRIVQHVWTESAEGSRKRGEMVTVHRGGGAISVPVSDLFCCEERPI